MDGSPRPAFIEENASLVVLASHATDVVGRAGDQRRRETGHDSYPSRERGSDQPPGAAPQLRSPCPHCTMRGRPLHAA
jgi:hypothetical protein